MKTEPKCDADILSITMKIQQEFPELSKYIEEIPLRDLEIDVDGTDVKVQKDYYDSLMNLIADYSKTHTTVINKGN